MKKFLFSLIVFFCTATPSFAFDLSLEDQALTVGKYFSMDILTEGNAAPPFVFALHSSSIPSDEWSIYQNTFSWTPKKSGLYTATFSAIDSQGNFAEKSILFSVVAKFQETREIEKKTYLPVPEEKMFELPERSKTKYLRPYEKKDLHLYQPVSFYYTRGYVPVDLALERYGQGASIICNEGAYFFAETNFAYRGKLSPPLWRSSEFVKSYYNVGVPKKTEAILEIDIPKNIKVNNCSVRIINSQARSYRFYSFTSGIFSSMRPFESGQSIALRSGGLIFLGADNISSPLLKKESPTPLQDKENPYLTSLYSVLPQSLQAIHKKNALTRADMAALIIYSLTSLGEKVETEKKRSWNYWGFSDVRRTEKYRGEISLLKKYGYDSGIRNDFRPQQTASMKDFYFALSSAMDLQLKWWQEKQLFKEMKRNGLVENMKEFKDPLTLERAAKAIFFTQEVLTKRAYTHISDTDPLFLLFQSNGIVNKDIHYRAKKYAGVSRADFTEMLVKNYKKDFEAIEFYRKSSRLNNNFIYQDIKRQESVAPYVFYLYKQDYLPDSWRASENFFPEKRITRSEALEIILKAQGLYDDAQKYFQKYVGKCVQNTQDEPVSCNGVVLWDLQDPKILEEDTVAFYAKKQGMISDYIDRYENEIPVFLGAKDVSLKELLEMFSVKN